MCITPLLIVSTPQEPTTLTGPKTPRRVNVYILFVHLVASLTEALSVMDTVTFYIRTCEMVRIYANLDLTDMMHNFLWTV